MFSKDGKTESNTVIYEKTLTFENAEKTKHLQVDSNNNTFYHFNQGEEWGPSLKIPIGEIVPNNYYVIESAISILNKDKEMQGQLVFEISDNKKSLAWRSSNTKKWITNTDQWQHIYYSVQLNEIIKPYQLTKNAVLKIYFWNQNKTPISIDNLSIKISKGNNKIYSLLENFPK